MCVSLSFRLLLPLSPYRLYALRSCVTDTEIPYLTLTRQVLGRTDLESTPQTLGAHGLEEKNSADRCCGACSLAHHLCRVS